MSSTSVVPVVSFEKPALDTGQRTKWGRPADHSWLALPLLGLMCAVLFFYGLGTGELYRTESLRAIIGAEFLRSGNWVVPTLYGEPLFTKPPGMYAAIALASWPFGRVTEWTARLPSALAATLAVLLFYWHFGRALGRLGGLVAAALLPLSFMWLDKASAAEIDMMQVAWATGAILCFLRALEEAEESGRLESVTVLGFRVASDGEVLQHSKSQHQVGGNRRAECLWWLAALLCVAGGVLTKWTAPAFFYGTVVPLLFWRRRLRLLIEWPHLISALVGAGICLGWIATAVALAGWEPFYNTVSREALMRLLPSHHDRPYPWLETLRHPFLILASNLPLTLFALFALRPSFGQLWDDRGRRLLQAMHCWVWPNLLFWSIIPEHAPRHSFPLFPGVAGIAAFVWAAWLTGRLRWPLAAAWRPLARPAYVLAGLLVIWLGVKLVFVHAVIPARNHNREPQAKGALLAELVPQGQTLYLFQLKDEGIMFYFGRTVRRLPSPAHLPTSTEPLYCILDAKEWRQWQQQRTVEKLQSLTDEQGDAIVLARMPGGP
jgi:4-amino-4-deoxy-L-arabinose transferase-like glycosyltransferase